MALDLAHRRTVASVLGLAMAVGGAGCGSRVQVEGVPAGPSGPDHDSGARPSSRFGHDVLVGEMCPQAASGRAALAPVLARQVGWDADPDALTDLIERGAVARYLVLGYDGAKAGTFDASEIVASELPQAVTAGVYVGQLPCTRDVGAGARAEDTKCNAAAKGCGLAIGEIDAASERAPVIAATRLGGACAVGNTLVVDIDGDGRPETFALASFLDDVRAPAERVVAMTAAAPTCTPTFSIHGLQVAPGVEPGSTIDPQYLIGLDLLGVVDLDDDGLRDLVFAVRFPTERVVMVFAATTAPTVLDRAGESLAWP